MMVSKMYVEMIRTRAGLESDLWWFERQADVLIVMRVVNKTTPGTTPAQA
jgi:hypothetical protein